MSHQQETRFRCDRCQLEQHVAHNDQPSLERGKPPPGWIALYTNTTAAAPSHLCDQCTPMFRAFMEEISHANDD